MAKAIERRIPVIEVEGAKLDKITGGANHQGVAASAAAVGYSDLEDIFSRANSRGGKASDSNCRRNRRPAQRARLSAVPRAPSAHGVIIGKRHAVGLSKRGRQSVGPAL